MTAACLLHLTGSCNERLSLCHASRHLTCCGGTATGRQQRLRHVLSACLIPRPWHLLLRGRNRVQGTAPPLCCCVRRPPQCRGVCSIRRQQRGQRAQHLCSGREARSSRGEGRADAMLRGDGKAMQDVTRHTTAQRVVHRFQALSSCGLTARTTVCSDTGHGSRGILQGLHRLWNRRFSA